MNLVELDEYLGGLETEDLVKLSTILVRLAEEAGVCFPASTRLHCFAMCLADRLMERGVPIP